MLSKTLIFPPKLQELERKRARKKRKLRTAKLK